MNRYKIFASIVIIFVILGCTKKGYLEQYIPKKLAGLDLIKTKVGEEAVKSINLLHKKNVSGIENIVASYEGAGHSADLFLSTFLDTMSAIQSFHGMMKGVSRDSVNFSHFTPRLIGNNNNVIMVLGLGQAHYFYTSGKEIYWLQADYDIAEKAISELLSDVIVQ